MHRGGIVEDILGATLINLMSAPLLSVGGAAKLPMILGAHSALHLLYSLGDQQTQTALLEDMIVVRIFERVTPTRKFWRLGRIEPASARGKKRQINFVIIEEKPIRRCPIVIRARQLQVGQDVSC